MALDLAALRRKAAELNGQRKGLSSVQLWKPGLGEHTVRCLPWPNPDQGMPIMERSFYSLGSIKQFLAPSQFGHEDPIEEFRRKLFESKDPEEKILAKTLFPKVYGYLPVIDRADEAKGVQIWKMSKMLYNEMINYFLDEEVGDYLDLETGRDIKVTVTQVVGKKYHDTKARPKMTVSPVHQDNKKTQEWLKGIPKLDDLHPYAVKSLPEVKSLLNQWLSGDAVSQSSDGAEKGNAGSNPVDELSKELAEKKVSPKKEAKKEEQPKADDKPVKAKVKEAPKDEPEDDSEATSSAKVDLDSAFDDLMNDD